MALAVRITFDPPISVEEHCKVLQAYDNLYNIAYVLEEDTTTSIVNHFGTKAFERVLENPGDFIPENQKLTLVSAFTGSIGVIFTGTAKALDTVHKIMGSVHEIVRQANERVLHSEQVREKIQAESKNIVAESRKKESEALINEEIANMLSWEVLKSQVDKLREFGVPDEKIRELIVMRVRTDTIKILQTRGKVLVGFTEYE
jgi:Flp pilus assembly secretin CpaC